MKKLIASLFNSKPKLDKILADILKDDGLLDNRDAEVLHVIDAIVRARENSTPIAKCVVKHQSHVITKLNSLGCKGVALDLTSGHEIYIHVTGPVHNFYESEKKLLFWENGVCAGFSKVAYELLDREARGFISANLIVSFSTND